jgi:hypothetical protein
MQSVTRPTNALALSSRHYFGGDWSSPIRSAVQSRSMTSGRQGVNPKRLLACRMTDQKASRGAGFLVDCITQYVIGRELKPRNV